MIELFIALSVIGIMALLFAGLAFVADLFMD